jgi:hypothetical protein
VYALSTAQMSQMEAIFGGDAVKTAIMAIIYTADGGAEQVAWSVRHAVLAHTPPQLTWVSNDCRHHASATFCAQDDRTQPPV